MRRIMTVAAIALGWAMCAHGGVQDSTTKLKVQLNDGSCVIGKPSVSSIRLTTDYARMDIPISIVSRLELSGTDDSVKASLKNGDSLQGHWGADEIALDTIFGAVKIPVSLMRDVTVIGGDKTLNLPDGLVLRYPFQSDEGKHVTDASGKGSDGEMRGGSFVRDANGRGAIEFDENGEYVDAGNADSLRLQDFTIVAWVKRGDVGRASWDGDDAVVFGFGNGGYFLGMHAAGGLFLSRDDFDHVDSGCRVTNQEFHQIAVTKQEGEVSFYLDGERYSAGGHYNPGFTFDTHAAVGARADTHGCGFVGSIGEVDVFNRALSADEMKSLYEAQK